MCDPVDHFGLIRIIVIRAYIAESNYLAVSYLDCVEAVLRVGAL